VSDAARYGMLAAGVGTRHSAICLDGDHASVQQSVGLRLVNLLLGSISAATAEPAVSDESVARRDDVNRISAECIEGRSPFLEYRHCGVDAFVAFGGRTRHAGHNPMVECGSDGKDVAAHPTVHEISDDCEVVLHRGPKLAPHV
jgi:hypothetical protein